MGARLFSKYVWLPPNVEQTWPWLQRGGLDLMQKGVSLMCLVMEMGQLNLRIGARLFQGTFGSRQHAGCVYAYLCKPIGLEFSWGQGV